MVEAAAPSQPYQLPIVTKIFLAAFIALALGVFLDKLLQSYVAAVTGVKVGLYAGLACGFAGLLSGFLPFKAPATVFKRILAGLFFGAIFFGLGYFDFTVTLPTLYTQFFGTPENRDTVIESWSQTSKTCKGINVASETPYRHVCLGGHLESQLPPGTKVTLVGRASVFGMAVQSVRWQD